MSRHNPDHYKVSGKEFGARDQTAQSRAKFATEVARLRQATPRVSGKSAKEPARTRSAKPERPTAKAPAPQPPPTREAPVAIIREIHPAKVKHGKKRRSSQKRHEVAVLHEFEASRRPAGRAALSPSSERPEAHGPTTAPPSVHELMVRLRRAGVLGSEALTLLRDLVRSPLVLARLLWSLRQQQGGP